MTAIVIVGLVCAMAGATVGFLLLPMMRIAKRNYAYPV
jgi:hypothetical protein